MLGWIFWFAAILLVLAIVAAIIYGRKANASGMGLLIYIAAIGGLITCVIVGATVFTDEIDVKMGLVIGRDYYIHGIVYRTPIYDKSDSVVLTMQKMTDEDKLTGPVFLYGKTKIPDWMRPGQQVEYQGKGEFELVSSCIYGCG